MVAVVGRLFQKWFPAQPNLSYTFIWDKTDAYGQRVYGLSEAVGELISNRKSVLKVLFCCCFCVSSVHTHVSRFLESFHEILDCISVNSKSFLNCLTICLGSFV